MSDFRAFALICIAVLFASAASYGGEPKTLMAELGDPIVDFEFNQASEFDKTWIKFRKQTGFSIEEGAMRVSPPVMRNIPEDKRGKWWDSNFARAGLVGLPMDYVCTAKWKYIRPANTKDLEKGLLYLDMGHRMIRVTLNREGATLILENHLIGRHEDKAAIVLDEVPDLKLTPNRWYMIVAEIKGDEVVLQIGDQVLYWQTSSDCGRTIRYFQLRCNGGRICLGLHPSLDLWIKA
ncbi:MAG: hypothetical protein AAGB46_17180 [Verrucomicrobiota bacterium]